MPFVPCDDCQTKVDCANNHEYGRPIQCRQAEGGRPLPIDRPVEKTLAMPDGPAEAADGIALPGYGSFQPCAGCLTPSACGGDSSCISANYKQALGERISLPPPPQFDAVIVEIAKLQLQAGDILAVSVPSLGATHERMQAMGEQLNAMLPTGVSCLVFNDQISLSVVRAGESA